MRHIGQNDYIMPDPDIVLDRAMRAREPASGREPDLFAVEKRMQRKISETVVGIDPAAGAGETIVMFGLKRSRSKQP
jgi:hypothetical protein